jgi:hypothetical protein
MSILHQNIVSSEAVQAAVVRLICASITKMCASGGSVLTRFGSVRRALETEFACDFSAKRDFIMDSIVATVKQGKLKSGVFICDDLTLNCQEEMTGKKARKASNVQDRDELVFSFVEYTEPAVTDKKCTVSSEDDGDELVYAFGHFPQPSNEALQMYVERLINSIVSARQELSVRSVRQTLEAQFSCDLSARKEVVLMYIGAALKNDILHEVPIKKEVKTQNKRRKLHAAD